MTTIHSTKSNSIRPGIITGALRLSAVLIFRIMFYIINNYILYKNIKNNNKYIYIIIKQLNPRIFVELFNTAFENAPAHLLSTVMYKKDYTENSDKKTVKFSITEPELRLGLSTSMVLENKEIIRRAKLRFEKT